ncbi:MAG TPA: biopolymer transporter ExbD [Spirochaetia bacterium]|nr:biopolymer transporter ExbD [Spirochaetia bacterium]
MRSLRSRHSNGLMAGINITPFTDVVLVLLVIFMIATPLIIQSGMKVNLPATSSAESQPEKSIVITIDSSGAVYLGKERVMIDDVRPRLTRQIASSPNAAVIVMGDRGIRYDTVIRVLDIARSSGARRLALGVEVRKDLTP